MLLRFRVTSGRNVVALSALLVAGAWAGGVPQQAAAPQADAHTPSVAPGTAVVSPADARREAWNGLNEGLAEKNYDRRAQAVAALGTIGTQRRAVMLIESSLDDKDAIVRQAAVEALAKMKSRSSIPKLQAALDDRSAVVSFAAAQALWAMGDRSGENIFEEVSGGDRKVSAGMIQEGLQKAHEELHDPAALAELGAVQAAGALLGPGGFGVEVALEMTKDKAAPARAISVRLLGGDSSAEAHDYLLAALGDKSWLVRAAAAEALGAQGASKDIEILRPFLKDPQKQVRYRAAAAIIRMTRPGMVESGR